MCARTFAFVPCIAHACCMSFSYENQLMFSLTLAQIIRFLLDSGFPPDFIGGMIHAL